MSFYVLFILCDSYTMPMVASFDYLGIFYHLFLRLHGVKLRLIELFSCIIYRNN